MSTPHTLTAAEARAWIIGHGMAFESVAKTINARKQDLNDVFSGRTAGMRGKAFRIHVALRLKPAPDDWNPQQFALPAAQTVRRWLKANGIEPSPHPGTGKHGNKRFSTSHGDTR